MEPLAARLPTWVPLTNSRSVAPSYVVARCVQTPAASAEEPRVSTSNGVETCPLGRFESVCA